MVSWPGLGTRVTVRYRRPAGSMPPLTDAVGRLLAVDPTVRVQTKTGTIVEFSPVDVVALRVLTDAPVRTAAIRALEHAAAAAWPGVERTWLDGWLLRAGHGAVLAANSAVPLDISAHTNTITEISAWYASRDLQPWLAVPDRLLPLPAGLAGERREQVLVRDVSTGEPDRSVTLPTDDDVWSTEFFAGCTHVSEPERKAFNAIVDAQFTDVVRPFTPGPGVYTYWDYTQLRFPKKQGMRIDFILGSPALAARVMDAQIVREERKGKAPSDHAPVLVDLHAG